MVYGAALMVGIAIGCFIPMRELTFAERWEPANNMPRAKQLVPMPIDVWCEFQCPRRHDGI